jgi:hypothetical protein
VGGQAGLTLARDLRDDKGSIVTRITARRMSLERIMMTRTVVARIVCVLSLASAATVAHAQSATDNEWFKSAYTEKDWNVRTATELRDIFRAAKLDDAAQSLEDFVDAAKHGRKLQLDGSLRNNIEQAVTMVASNGGDAAEAERAKNSFLRAFGG